ncbi:MAG: TerL protein, partial [Bacteroidetes bacterium]|nr:TerL protein [Bacteroidota bacterium]
MGIIKLDYSNPDYTEIFMDRQKRLQDIRNNPQIVVALKVYYRDNPWDFIRDWGFTFDPRQIEKGKLATFPFIPWPKQVEFLKWIDERWKAGEYGIVEKSRDCGVTWLLVAFFVTNWLFVPGFTAGLASAKEDKV